MSATESPVQAARNAKRTLERMQRPAGKFHPARYFRGAADLGFYNVGTDAMRSLARSIYLAHRTDWSIDEAMAFANALVRDRHLEAKSLGIEVVKRYRRDFGPRLLPVWKRWLADNHAANWATTDAICCYLIGPLIVTRIFRKRRASACSSSSAVQGYCCWRRIRRKVNGQPDPERAKGRIARPRLRDRAVSARRS